MADLEAQGPGPSDRRRWVLPPRPVTLGRSDKESDWAVPWDMQVSRLHATLQWEGGRLRVTRRPRTTNQIFYKEQAADDFSVGPGEKFVIGETVFSLLAEETGLERELPTPQSELTCSAEELRLFPYVDAAQRIEVLADLPGIIRHSPSEEELEKRVLDVLLRGIPRAEAVAVVWIDTTAQAEPRPIRVQSQAQRDRGTEELSPSRRLISEAVLSRRQSVMHIWRIGDLNPDYSVPQGCDWAICSPLPDAPYPGFALYVTGRLLERALLGGPTREGTSKSDLKFAELVAEVFGALRQVRDLERRQAVLSRFLPPQVLAALADENIDVVLQPRKTDVTVLFCDLRGSSRIAEDAGADLAGLWDAVSPALSIMAGSIVDLGGVIGDFQGDAVMGFWGWPLPVEDQVERAALAALNIQRRFTWAAQQPDRPRGDFSCGIGIAHGPAIAGRLGSIEQFKVDVFGPVVNLASRLESLTKVFSVPILVDEHIAERLASCKDMRCRRLARVRPFGMRAVLTVSELWRPGGPGQLSSQDRRDFEAAFDAFGAGRWDDARRLLQHISRDGPTSFLKQFMDRHPNGPPASWDGVIVMESK